MGSMHDKLKSPAERPIIAPSILSADFAFMYRDCEHVVSQGATWLHLDVMDGHFVPNLTMGPDMCRGLRASLPNAFLDVHLMVREPERFVEPFAKAGANNLTYHAEIHRGRQGLDLIKRIHDLGVLAGIAINPSTPASTIDDVLEAVDLVLVMSVNPGFSGQAFIEQVLEKVREIKPKLRGDQRLQMDGGVNLATAGACREAGCDCIVAASAIFSKPLRERGEVIAKLKGLDGAGEVRARVVFRGRVQGVGFRATASTIASVHAVTGWVRNEADGSVLMEVQGRPSAIEGYLGQVREQLGHHIQKVERADIATEPSAARFVIRS